MTPRALILPCPQWLLGIEMGGDSIFFFGGPSLSYHPRAWITCPGWPDLGRQGPDLPYCRWRMQHVSVERQGSPLTTFRLRFCPACSCSQPQTRFPSRLHLGFLRQSESQESLVLLALRCSWGWQCLCCALRFCLSHGSTWHRGQAVPAVRLMGGACRCRRVGWLDGCGGVLGLGVAPYGLASTHQPRIIRTGGGIGQLQEEQKSERGCGEGL
jgi:hypothetical protein